MRRQHLVPLLFLGAALAAVPATAQALRVEVLNLRRTIISPVWGSGSWVIFTQEEEERDLNGDRDTDDTVAFLGDMRTVSVQATPIAVDYAVTDALDDWPGCVAGESVVLLASEADTGGRDLNGNKKPADNVFVLYNPATKQFASLGAGGHRPIHAGGKLYVARDEGEAGADLNGDRDVSDSVLTVIDLATRKPESLGMDASGGCKIAGDWIAVLASETAQGGRDLNGDRDVADQVVQLYQISQKRWVSTGLDASDGFALTPKLLIASVNETRQGNQDQNGDKDVQDTIAFVWDLAAGTSTNTRQDSSGGVVADGGIAGFASEEKAQGGQDLNGDRDATDTVVQVFTVGSTQALSLKRDASGGIAAGAGKIAFAAGETEQGRDLNGDKDLEDTVVLLYDPVKNSVAATALSMTGDLYAAEGVAAWMMSEADQGNRDFNRDRDMDDDILCVLDFATGAFTAAATATSDHVTPTSRGVAFGVYEIDQGDRDLNMNMTTDDEVLHVARIAGR